MAVTMKNSWARFSGSAGETLAVGDIVCIKESDGKVYKADANDAALRPSVGIITKGGAINAGVQITMMGLMGGYSAQTKGQPVYLSETPGLPTQAAPTWSQQIGWAIGATQTVFNFGHTGS